MGRTTWAETNARFHAEEAAWRDAQPAKESCLFCGWSVEGMAGEARQAALEHRLAEHPETKGYRRPKRTRQLGNFRPAPMNGEEVDEVQADRIRRAFLNGVEIDL